MPSIPDTKLIKTSGGGWTDFIAHTGPGYTTLLSLSVKNTAIGTARVGYRFAQAGGLTNEISGPDALPENGSYRYRLPAIRLKAGDKVQVNSLGGVDWIANTEVTT